jgi:hypothetical protein
MHDGEELRNRPILDRKAALARLLPQYRGWHSMSTSPRMALSSSRTLAGLV